MNIAIYAFGITLAFAAVSAYAEGGGPCREDVQKYCAQSQGQGPRKIEDCLLDHQQDVSDACYGALKKRIEGGQGGQGGGAMQACRGDFQQYCKGVQPGGGRIVDCLLGHQKDLSDACYDAMAKKTQGAKGR